MAILRRGSNQQVPTGSYLISKRTDHAKMTAVFFLFLLFLPSFRATCTKTSSYPIVINTWAFVGATDKAWQVINTPGQTAVDAAVAGARECELEQCDGTVGFGGSPDENGETTLDSLVLDGTTMNMGSVGGLRRIKDAVLTARMVMNHTEHSILVGDLATEFAKKMGFPSQSLTTKTSKTMWKEWQKNSCQPNFWKNVQPNPAQFCGPYKPLKKPQSPDLDYKKRTHDTISIAVIDCEGRIAVATSSNGAKYKIPGRMGDASIAGAGAYADSEVGAALATGDGDVMMRFLPSFLIVEKMRGGASPQSAVTEAIQRIARYFPSFSGAVIGINKEGKFAAACNGIDRFPFSVYSPNSSGVEVLSVNCSNANVKSEL